MNVLFRFIIKLGGPFRRERFRNELDEEMAFHRVQLERELVARGVTPEGAHRSRCLAVRQCRPRARAKPGCDRIPRRNSAAGCAIRAAAIAQESRLRGHGNRHPGAGDCVQCGDIRIRGRGPDQAFALRAARPVGAVVREHPARPALSPFVSGHAGAQGRVGEPG